MSGLRNTLTEKKSIEDLYNQMNFHLLTDKKPSLFFNTIDEKLSDMPFIYLKQLKNTPQSKKHHPEGNVWNHTMMVVDEAAKVREICKNPKVFMWAALLHDIGKSVTTKIKKDKITSYDHDKIGADMTKEFLSYFSNDSYLIDCVTSIVRWHMQMLFVVNSLPFANVEGMAEQVDIQEIALFGYCDRMGRLGAIEEEEKLTARKFIRKCNEKLPANINQMERNADVNKE